MARRGTLVQTTVVGPGVTLETVFTPDTRNPIENIPIMRQQLIRNIGEIAALVARDMEEYAQSHFEWSPQPPTIHNLARGYPNDHAHEQIEAEAFADIGADQVSIFISHPKTTVQNRTGVRGGQGEPVYYGEILEFGFDGRYAILQETVQEFTDDLMALMQGHAMEGMNFVGAGKRPGRAHTIRR